MLKDSKFNQIKGIACLLLVLVSAYSCEDLVEETPISEISPDSFFTNNDNLEAALMGVYDGVQGTYRDKTFFWGEFRSDNHAPFGTANQDQIEIVNNNITPGNGAVRWDRLYRSIDRANEVINNAPNIPSVNENYLAEALALRAKMYFDAVRVWGAVPLFTKSVEQLSEALKPVTDGDIIMNEVVIPDMLRAEELMTTRTNKFRFSRASIYCLQAEVYMWLNDYPKAKKAIENMMALGEHRLVTTPEAWDELFYNNPDEATRCPGCLGKIQEGPELILSIRYDVEEDRDFGGSRNNRSAIRELFFGGIPSYVMSPAVENKWREKFPIDSTEWVTKYPNTDPALTKIEFVDNGMGGVDEVEVPVYGDWRYYFSRQGRVEGFGSVEIGEARTAKWNQVNFDRNTDDTDIVLYRYADMILLLAEAENFLQADGAAALALVNQIRTARQLPLVDEAEFGATQDERLDFILDERQFELFGEGKRWWDLVRNNKAMEVLNPILETVTDAAPITSEARLLWPIHNEHLIENPLLDQNQDY
ncbi:hypothetical protein BWZ22_11700 [Seonamhaeicola sp. S2-3]|uniref:RagB/SusD family nutrient uptake outer membrane protein n=1 Tax=Seonamhaeicola sp. S2-3 TaxID=1936081 RepID=UPI000972B34D|nr:RagB/SusD family nutrient uptake outer membrane protein [Seonamhaeicola sp. S2-3]APY11856.1 hypothetical protein BWZ22_11700 [Seonamhaeicola sp. S2-3]